ncbi:putative reverse transcriptase [Trichonephila inaurata madagascariensis]|uniref:Putative reverse transcriptase n=1 Tax=Trichonephila inaurata madagascariensis TaxID=2747483 RepID=A0A8X7C9G8_9ARAC|nr:putative reverse transcriptase [Trichonephila inaurata madagascariensis]
MLPLAPRLESTSATQPPGDTPPLSTRPATEGEESKIDLPAPTALDSFLEPLDTLLEIEELAERKMHFNAIVEGITSAVQEHFNLKRPPTNTTNSTRLKGLDTKDPQKVQSMYRWNRRKCVRAIVNSDSQRCNINKERVQEHFKATWECPDPVENEVPRHIPSPTTQDPPERPPVLESLTPKAVAASLRAAENSAPGPDLISYKHWREIDPSCKVLSRIFNICLKIADIPDVWKTSRTILIHKGDSPDLIENWRPISLPQVSNCSKCLGGFWQSG